MKRITLFLALVLGVGLSAVQAQKCSKAEKAACAKSAQVSDKGHCAGSSEAAAKLASLDDAIESRTCEKSGSVCYVRKVVNQETGETSYADVQYDSELGKFVNVSPSSKGKGCCAKMASAGCCAGKKGVKTADSETTPPPTPQKATIHKKS